MAEPKVEEPRIVIHDLHANAWLFALERLLGPGVLRGWRGPRAARLDVPGEKVRGQWVALAPDTVPLGSGQHLSEFQLDEFLPVRPDLAIELDVTLGGEQRRVEPLVELDRCGRASASYEKVQQEGVRPSEVFDGIKQAIVADRYAYFDDFFANFYNTDVLAPERIGDAALRASFHVAAGSSPYATYACVDTWLTDFRGDLPKIDVPTLVVHGTADRILPFEATAARLQEEALIADLTVVPVQDGPHNIGWTHPDDVNAALLEFLG